MNEKLLEMIKNDMETDIICAELNITKEQLKNEVQSLRNNGFNLENKLFFNGITKYAMNYTIAPDVDLKIYANNKDDRFMCLVIGDTHFGHKLQNLDYLKIIYEYAKENNINIILHLGDLLEGTADSKIPLKEQLQYVVESYPKDKNIKNIITFGNHEEPFVEEEGIDLKNYLASHREDFIPLDFGLNTIELDNNYGYIFTLHHGNIGSTLPGIRIFGHSHRFKYVSKPNYPVLTVPTLSDKLHTSVDIPGAIEIEILKHKDNQNTLLINHLVIPEDKKVKNVSRMQQSLQRKK